MDNEKTLVLIKPDGVKRGLTGEILSRFERAGMKVIGMKMLGVNEDFAKRHYTEDITERRGETVRNHLLKFIQSGPIVALCLEGVDVIENVRKMVGTTEPKSALPGTIRGDYAHVSYKRCDDAGKAVENLIHASADQKDATHEVALWFSAEELQKYTSVHEAHTF